MVFWTNSANSIAGLASVVIAGTLAEVAEP
jgi:hypothetical protein